MQLTKRALTLSVILVLLASSGVAYAWHRGPRVGVFVGGPLWYGPGYYPPVYYPSRYYAPVYYPPVAAAPPVYIEQGVTQPAPEQQQAYWYYCAESKAYYPYVDACPGGWQRVSPQPPPG
jgi:hypothetical protein